MRVKTPTAAAEWLIARATENLDALQRAGDDILALVTSRISGCMTQLSFYEGMLPTAAMSSLTRAGSFLDKARISMAGVAGGHILPERARLDAAVKALELAASNTVARARERLDSSKGLLGALSPEATLRRGYSVTRTSDGSTVTSASQLLSGNDIVTTFADGSVTSVVK